MHAIRRSRARDVFAGAPAVFVFPETPEDRKHTTTLKTPKQPQRQQPDGQDEVPAAGGMSRCALIQLP